MSVPDSRGSVPVLADVLLVGVVLVLGMVVITLSLGILGDTGSPAPIISESSGVVVPNSDGQTIAIRHVAGDVVRVRNMEVVVDAREACGSRARIVDLPADSEAYLTAENVQGDQILSTANRSTAEYDPGALTRERFGSGNQFRVRLTDRCPLDPGDQVTLVLIHHSEDAIISRTEIAVPER